MAGTTGSRTLDDPLAETAGSTTTAQAHPLVEAGQQATETAGHLAERAADLGLRQADRGRQQAADGIDNVAESIRRVSLDMQSDQPAIAGAASTAAEQAERVAQYLRQTDAREIISKVEDVARRQPLIFIGGAFVLGFAASRFLKAAGGNSSSDMDRRIGRQSGYATDYSRSNTYQTTGPGSTNRIEGV
jgi:hypothetical protein